MKTIQKSQLFKQFLVLFLPIWHFLAFFEKLLTRFRITTTKNVALNCMISEQNARSSKQNKTPDLVIGPALTNLLQILNPYTWSKNFRVLCNYIGNCNMNLIAYLKYETANHINCSFRAKHSMMKTKDGAFYIFFL